jgi:hypothetical protein
MAVPGRLRPQLDERTGVRRAAGEQNRSGTARTITNLPAVRRHPKRGGAADELRDYTGVARPPTGP